MRERSYPAMRAWALRGDSEHRTRLARRNAKGETAGLGAAEA